MRINGNLTLNTNGASQIENLVAERLTTLPTWVSTEKGRLVFNTTDGKLYLNDGITYIAVASGGSTGALQVEMDALEAALGTLITGSGTFTHAGTVYTSITNNSTTIAEILVKLDAAISGKTTTLAGATDVTITSAANKDILYYSTGSSKWINGQPGSAAGVQAYNGNLNVIAGLALAANGILTVNPGATAYELKTPASLRTVLGLDIGTNVQAFNSKLTDVAALAVTTNNFVTMNGTTFVSTTPANARTALGLGSAATTNAADYVPVVGGVSISGAITFTGGATLTGLPLPVNSTDAANKAYVDNSLTGLTWKTAVVVTTTGNITLSGLQTIDGVALVANDRVLVKNQTTGSENGIYLASASAWTRTNDADVDTEIRNSAILAVRGSTLAGSQWSNNNVGAIVVGTTALTYVQINGAGQISDGAGLLKTGNVLSVVTGAGIGISGDEVVVNTLSTGGLFTTIDGTAPSTANTARVALRLDGGSLSTTASGVRIAANGVTAAEIASAAIGNGLQGGGGTVVSVKSGTTVNGTAVAVSVAAGGLTVPLGSVAGTLAEGNHTHTLVALSDTSITAPATGQTVIYNGTTWVNKTTSFLYNGGANTAHTVTHGLGQQYLNVMVIDTATDEIIIPQSIKYNSTTVVVTLNVALALKIYVSI